jgi:hypothetical protein
MNYSYGLKFLSFGIIFTIVADIYVCSSSWILIVLAASRLIGMPIAVVYRMVFDYSDKNIDHEASAHFWNSLTNGFLVVTGVQQACVFYHWTASIPIGSVSYLVGQLCIPLVAYQWIRTIKSTDLRYVQEIGLDINDSKATSRECQLFAQEVCV